MRVLVMGAPGPATEEAILRVEGAGHEVVRCNDPREPAFPCKALTSVCPLDEQTVDAALAIRTHAWPRPTVFDRGVTCAIRQGIPIVLAGTIVLNPYEDWAAEVVGRNGDAVEALERVVSTQ